MKAENFANLILEKCLTKKGTFLVSDVEMLRHLIFNPLHRKRTFRWYNKGRSYRDTYSRDITLLKKLGVDYKYSNDAPRGGQEGNYIIITQKGLRRIKPFLKAYYGYVNNKDIEKNIGLFKLIAQKIW